MRLYYARREDPWTRINRRAAKCPRGFRNLAKNNCADFEVRSAWQDPNHSLYGMRKPPDLLPDKLRVAYRSAKNNPDVPQWSKIRIVRVSVASQFSLRQSLLPVFFTPG
jgi:hypothetical protein